VEGVYLCKGGLSGERKGYVGGAHWAKEDVIRDKKDTTKKGVKREGGANGKL
jgi:hypothetical protein